jgi:hypothetical protein
MDNNTKLKLLKLRLSKIESELGKNRTSAIVDGWQTSIHAKKSRNWDILAVRKMEIIRQIEEIEPR